MTDQESPPSQNRRVVLGIGNILNRDEGLGVHTLAPLTERLGDEAAVEIIDGGVMGLVLLPIVEACSHLLIIDAINAGQPPGTVTEMARDAIPLFTGVKMSEHQVTFQEVLGLATMRGKMPPFVHLVGAQPEDLSIGVGLSPALAAVIPSIIERAAGVLDEWGLLRTKETTDA